MGQVYGCTRAEKARGWGHFLDENKNFFYASVVLKTSQPLSYGVVPGLGAAVGDHAIAEELGRLTSRNPAGDLNKDMWVRLPPGVLNACKISI